MKEHFFSLIRRKLKNKIVKFYGGNTYGYRSVNGINHFLKDYISAEIENSVSCDLGCGRNIRNPFKASKLVGVDIDSTLGKKVFKANLSVEPIPFHSDSMNYITAFDFIEHIPRILYYRWMY